MKRHIAILDFGSQYMHLISRRIRQLGVYARIYHTSVNAHELTRALGIIISGGPQSVIEQKLPYDPGIFSLPVPILGLCYGHQLMAHHLRGEVTQAHHREYGLATLQVNLTGHKSPLFKGFSHNEQVWMSHWDSVTHAPRGFKIIGSTSDCPVAAMANEKTRRYGLQFHPEVQHTTRGLQLLSNFVFKICGARQNWSMAQYIKELQKDLNERIDDKRVFLLVSGGVDSTVTFALLEKILGKKRVYGLHIDNGFMRQHESRAVAQALAKIGFSDLHVVDASARFLRAVRGVVEPEEKRRIIGRTFIETERREFAKLGFNDKEWLLGQGTIYPDTIESGGTAAADVIKTHHNRVDEILEMINQGKVVEPLADLYKDEVREIGAELKLPVEVLERWPFPGPGLAIRCLCARGRETATSAPNAVEINKNLEALASPHDLFAQVLPVKSVGVQGDQRSYQHPALIFGWSIDKISQQWNELGKLSTAITNTVSGVNRVVVAVGGISRDVKPKNLRFTVAPKTLTRSRLNLLRKADAIVDEIVRRNGVMSEIWQFPVILLPLSLNKSNQGETVVLRPIQSQEAMTVNFYKMPALVLHEIIEKLLRLAGVDAVLYDITNKPPATIEWE